MVILIYNFAPWLGMNRKALFCCPSFNSGNHSKFELVTQTFYIIHLIIYSENSIYFSIKCLKNIISFFQKSLVFQCLQSELCFSVLFLRIFISFSRQEICHHNIFCWFWIFGSKFGKNSMSKENLYEQYQFSKLHLKNVNIYLLNFKQ